MAESVAEAFLAGAAGGAPPLVVHFTGSFHADFGQGTVERIRRRLPGKRVVIVTMVPVEKLDVPVPDAAETTACGLSGLHDSRKRPERFVAAGR